MVRLRKRRTEIGHLGRDADVAGIRGSRLQRLCPLQRFWIVTLRRSRLGIWTRPESGEPTLSCVIRLDHPFLESSSTMNTSSHPAAPETSVAKFDEGGILIGQPAGVACPACQSELRIGEIESCQFAGCPQCRGMLFKQEVFARMLRQRRENSAAPPKRQPRWTWTN